METLKIVLAMLALVLIGFIGGFATHRYLTMDRIKGVRNAPPGAGVEHRILRVIDPDDNKREIYKPIFDKWRDSMQIAHQVHKANRVVLIDSLVQDLIPLLDASQQINVQKEVHRYKEHSKHLGPPSPPGHHPPHGGLPQH